MLYVSNAFALSMLDRGAQAEAPRAPRPITLALAAEKAKAALVTCAVCGHGGDNLACDAREHGSWDAADVREDGYAGEPFRSSLVSCVGHADAAAVYAALLGVSIAANRANITLAPADELLVGQYVGPRLPEGATELPAGATIEWWLV